MVVAVGRDHRTVEGDLRSGTGNQLIVTRFSNRSIRIGLKFDIINRFTSAHRIKSDERVDSQLSCLRPDRVRDDIAGGIQPAVRQVEVGIESTGTIKHSRLISTALEERLSGISKKYGTTVNDIDDGIGTAAVKQVSHYKTVAAGAKNNKVVGRSGGSIYRATGDGFPIVADAGAAGRIGTNTQGDGLSSTSKYGIAQQADACRQLLPGKYPHGIQPDAAIEINSRQLVGAGLRKEYGTAIETRLVGSIYTPP